MARRQRLGQTRPQMQRSWLLGAAWFATAALILFAAQRGWRPLGLSSSNTALIATLFALGAVAVLIFTAALGWVARRPRPDDADVGASIADEALGLDDLLKAGIDAHVRDDEPATERAGAFRRLLIERAERAADRVDPDSLVPLQPARATWIVGALLIAAGLIPFLLTSDESLRASDIAEAAERAAAVSGPGDDAESIGQDEEPVVAEAMPLPELTAPLRLDRIDDASTLSDAELEELETMSPEELAALLEQMRNAQGGEAATGEPIDPSELADAEPGAERQQRQAQQAQASDGLEELARSAEDPFAGPEQQQAQAGGDPTEASAAAGDSAENEAVQRIELPPMANPNARQAEAGEARAAVAMAAADPSDAQAPPPEAPQSGAGGGESSGPQSGAENPFGEATELAVTLELALLEAEEENERPIERSIRHRASEAQDAKVTRSGRRSVDQSAGDRATPRPILSPAERARLGRYFDDARWPQTPPPR